MIEPVILMVAVTPLLVAASIVSVSPDILRTFQKINPVFCVLLLILAIVPRLAVGIAYFMGMEYEDSFVFAASSRSLEYQSDLFRLPLQSQSCVLGSLDDCQLDASFDGHFIFLPLLTYFTGLLIGYHPYLINVLNGAISLIAMIYTFLLAFQLTRSRVSAGLACLVYAVCPAMTIFHTSGLAETLSSLMILINLYTHIRLFGNGSSFNPIYIRVALWISLISSFVLAILTKRENVLLVALPCMSVVSLWRTNGPARRFSWIWALAASVISIVTIHTLDVVRVETLEARGIGAPTFSVVYALAYIPALVRALFTFSWFTVSTVFCLCGMWVVIWRSPQRKTPLVVPILFILYLVTYAMHYRSYYAIRLRAVAPFETLRYFTTVFPLFSVLCGMGVSDILRRLRKVSSWVGRHETIWGRGLLASWVLGSLVCAYFLRLEWTAMEWEARVAPAIETLRVVKGDGDLIVTDIPLVFQVFGSPNTRIIDEHLVDRGLSANEFFATLSGAEHVFWLRPDGAGESLDAARYPTSRRILKNGMSNGCRRVSGGYSLCRLLMNPPTETKRK